MGHLELQKQKLPLPHGGGSWVVVGAADQAACTGLATKVSVHGDDLSFFPLMRSQTLERETSGKRTGYFSLRLASRLEGLRVWF